MPPTTATNSQEREGDVERETHTEVRDTHRSERHTAVFDVKETVAQKTSSLLALHRLCLTQQRLFAFHSLFSITKRLFVFDYKETLFAFDEKKTVCFQVTRERVTKDCLLLMKERLERLFSLHQTETGWFQLPCPLPGALSLESSLSRAVFGEGFSALSFDSV